MGRVVGVIESGLFIGRADPGFIADEAGVHRLDGQLLVILNVDRVLDMTGDAIAA